MSLLIPINYVAVNPILCRQRSCSGEMPVQTSLGSLSYVAAGPTMYRQRSRSGEMPTRASLEPPSVLGSPGPARYGPSSRSASPTPSAQTSPSGEVPCTPLRYVPPSPAKAYRERSRSVEVLVEVLPSQKNLPQVKTPRDSKPAVPVESVGKENSMERAVIQRTCPLQKSAYSQATDKRPRVEKRQDAREKLCVDARKRFLDASSHSSAVIGAKDAMLVSEGTSWSAEEMSAGTVKLRWLAGEFHVIDKEQKNESPEAAPEPPVRYFDGSLEVSDIDWSALRELLANDLGVSIGDQPSTGLTGAVMIPGPEFFQTSEGQTSAAPDSTRARQTFCFPVLLRHPGFEHLVLPVEQDEEKTKVVAARTKEEEAAEKAQAAEQKALQAEVEREAACRRAIAAEQERDAEKANMETAKFDVAEAVAKVHAAEEKIGRAEEECDADHRRAIAVEKERDDERAKAEAAKCKEEEAMAKAEAAEQKAVEAEAEREAARVRAIAAETERDAEKAKLEAAKVEVAAAIAKLNAAEQKATQAEKERDAVKAWTIAERLRQAQRQGIRTTSSFSSRGSTTPEVFDISQGDTPMQMDSPDSRRTFCFPVPADTQNAEWSTTLRRRWIAQIPSDAAPDSFTPVEADDINLDTVEERLGEPPSAETVHAEDVQQTCSKPADGESPADLETEAAFAHAYLTADDCANLVFRDSSLASPADNSCKQSFA
mmetsp:Transcript_17977/g.33391  ORF Transcript_17977/g.33391 Transcript_17977/m.33391 type:complete len:712 (+) Transcript_17977:115-2250(+)